MSNITQFVNTDKNMTTLKKSIHASDLDQILSSTGPYTLFAPSDMAFGKLDSKVIEDLLKVENKATLTDLVKKHVIDGKISFTDLKNGEKLKTLNGKELTVEIKDGKVLIDGSVIQSRDLKASNGVIHSLDTVLKN
ncbi:MAG TPA: fasciclin domain-containing protein [Chitinophagaceae bacterium]